MTDQYKDELYIYHLKNHHKYIITAVLKDEIDIITSIAASPIVIMYVKTLKLILHVLFLSVLSIIINKEFIIIIIIIIIIIM